MRAVSCGAGVRRYRGRPGATLHRFRPYPQGRDLSGVTTCVQQASLSGWGGGVTYVFSFVELSFCEICWATLVLFGGASAVNVQHYCTAGDFIAFMPCEA